MLYRAIGNVLHHLPAAPRGPYVLKRLRTRIEPPKPKPNAAPRWRFDEPELIPVEREPFIDVCQAHRLWANRLLGHWSTTTFDLKRLARKLGKKPWYRPWNCPE